MKRLRVEAEVGEEMPQLEEVAPAPVPEPVLKNYFDQLQDDIVVCILAKLSSSATSPSDLMSALSADKRFSSLGLHPKVLSEASPKALAVKAEKWSESAFRFLKRCVDAGNVEACFMMGMILFYCLGKRSVGTSLMAEAAMRSHAESLYSLAIIQFNGTGRPPSERDIETGVLLCAQAASLGHVEALRELGHCLQEGYGLRCSMDDGRRLLAHASVRELAAVLPSALAAAESWSKERWEGKPLHEQPFQNWPLLSDYNWSFPDAEPHPANRFLVDWFDGDGGADLDSKGLRVCDHHRCGRSETRPDQFLECADCDNVSYCSRSCQILDWKIDHEATCQPELGHRPLPWEDIIVPQ